jgi:hypothetical protein
VVGVGGCGGVWVWGTRTQESRQCKRGVQSVVHTHTRTHISVFLLFNPQPANMQQRVEMAELGQVIKN